MRNLVTLTQSLRSLVEFDYPRREMPPTSPDLDRIRNYEIRAEKMLNTVVDDEGEIKPVTSESISSVLPAANQLVKDGIELAHHLDSDKLKKELRFLSDDLATIKKALGTPVLPKVAENLVLGFNEVLSELGAISKDIADKLGYPNARISIDDLLRGGQK